MLTNRILIPLLFVLFLSCENSTPWSKKDPACNAELQAISIDLKLDSFDITVDEGDFCKGWYDAKDIEEYIYFIKGSPGLLSPCIYCDVINNKGRVIFTDDSVRFKNLSFNDRNFSYYLGLNKRIHKKHNQPYPKERCSDSTFFDKDYMKKLLEVHTSTKWDQKGVLIKIDTNMQVFKLKDLDVKINTEEKAHTVPFNTFYEGYFLQTSGKSVGIEISLEKYVNLNYCHSRPKKFDKLVFYIRSK